MRRLAALLAAAILAATAQASPALADTHAPCARHGAVTPYVDLVLGDGTSILRGAGDIGGCPVPYVDGQWRVESATVTVCLQLLVDGAWADQACDGPVSRSWSRYTRFARQVGASVDAVCVPGSWRTDVRGGDGFDPAEWASDPAVFAALDSGVCGAFGGGD